jgi:hypothetical protein
MSQDQHRAATGGFASDCHILGITAKRSDVTLHPAHATAITRHPAVQESHHFHRDHFMVSALLATARPIFYEQMRQVTGLPDQDIRNAVAAIRRGRQEATTERAFEAPAALRAQIREASEVAFGIGVGRCFLVAAIACLLCAVLVWMGAHRQAQDVPDRPPQGAT